MKRPQAYRPEHPTFVQGATIVVGCMVAAFTWWGITVLLLIASGAR